MTGRVRVRVQGLEDTTCVSVWGRGRGLGLALELGLALVTVRVRV